jgi:hypothetical protein
MLATSCKKGRVQKPGFAIYEPTTLPIYLPPQNVFFTVEATAHNFLESEKISFQFVHSADDEI